MNFNNRSPKSPRSKKPSKKKRRIQSESSGFSQTRSTSTTQRDSPKSAPHATSSTVSSSETSSSSASSSMPEIPGFYYDEKLKKYFKKNPNCLRYIHDREESLSKIMHMEVDEPEEEEVKLSKSSKHKATASTNSGAAPTLFSKSSTLFSQIYQREMGFRRANNSASFSSFEEDALSGVVQSRYKNLQHVASPTHLSLLNHLNYASDLHCLAGSCGDTISLCYFQEPEEPITQMDKIKISDVFTSTFSSAITSMHYSSNYKLFLSTTLGAGTPAALYLTAPDSKETHSLFSVNKYSINTSALHEDMITLGTRNFAYVLSLSQQRLAAKIRVSDYSDILAQEFASDGNILYNGLRNGELRMLDLRTPTKPVTSTASSSRSRRPQQKVQPASNTMIWKHQHPITHIKAIPNEEHNLIISTMSGDVAGFDFRMQRLVAEYKKQPSSNAINPQIMDNLHVRLDPCNSDLLTIAGQDSKTLNIISRKTGQTVHQIQHPMSKKQDVLWTSLNDSNSDVVLLFGAKGHELKYCTLSQ